MSKKKKSEEVKETKEEAIEPWYPRDMFRAFDEMWEDFRKDFLRPWRRGWLWGRPRRMGLRPWNIMTRREGCADLVDSGKEFQVCVEVPGIPRDRIDINLTKSGIEISGKTGVERKKEEQDFVVSERGYSEIYRKMMFPEEVVPEKAEATLKDGLLQIKIPKKTPTPKPKKHKVEIK